MPRHGENRSSGRRNRHDVIRFVAWLTASACLPLAWHQYQEVERQIAAVTTWQKAATCSVNRVSIIEPSAQPRPMFGRASPKMDVLYTYSTEEGYIGQSDRMYYYGLTHPGITQTAADRLVAYFEKGKCVAYYDPAAPGDAILVRELCALPHNRALTLAGVVLCVAWWVWIEHDYHTPCVTPDAFTKKVDNASLLSVADPRRNLLVTAHAPPAAQPGGGGGGSAQKRIDEAPLPEEWYVMAEPWAIRGTLQICLGSFLLVVWHAVGWHVWHAYVVHKHVSSNEETRFTYHFIGFALFFRLVHLLMFVAQVRDMRVYLDRSVVSMHKPFTVLIEQPRRCLCLPAFYEKVSAQFTLTQSVHGPKVGRGLKRQYETIHDTTLVALQPRTVSGAIESVTVRAPFPPHTCDLQFDDASEGNAAFHRWCLTISVYVAPIPIPHTVSITFAAELPEQLENKRKELAARKKKEDVPEKKQETKAEKKNK
ncbi:hypothetical protein DIPPA_10294 [Diplonema papillatum]|nr:hypothetical protein DIPPA_10294 [Diplonema papillatum]